MLVDLIGDDPDAVLSRPPADRRHLLGCVDGPGRVGRGDEDEQLGARGACGLQLLHRGAVSAGFVGVDDDGRATRELDGLGVRRPVWRGEDRLVAGVEECGERVVEGLLAAVGDEDLAGLGVVAAVSQGLGRDGLAQLRQAGRGGVAVPSGVAAGGHGRLDDVVRRGEVGLSRPEADDGATGRLEGLGLGIDGEGRGLGDGGKAPGDSGGHGGIQPAWPGVG